MNHRREGIDYKITINPQRNTVTYQRYGEKEKVVYSYDSPTVECIDTASEPVVDVLPLLKKLHKQINRNLKNHHIQKPERKKILQPVKKCINESEDA